MNWRKISWDTGSRNVLKSCLYLKLSLGRLSSDFILAESYKPSLQF